MRWRSGAGTGRSAWMIGLWVLVGGVVISLTVIMAGLLVYLLSLVVLSG